MSRRHRRRPRLFARLLPLASRRTAALFPGGFQHMPGTAVNDGLPGADLPSGGRMTALARYRPSVDDRDWWGRHAAAVAPGTGGAGRLPADLWPGGRVQPV